MRSVSVDLSLIRCPKILQYAAEIVVRFRFNYPPKLMICTVSQYPPLCIIFRYQNRFRRAPPLTLYSFTNVSHLSTLFSAPAFPSHESAAAAAAGLGQMTAASRHRSLVSERCLPDATHQNLPCGGSIFCSKKLGKEAAIRAEPCLLHCCPNEQTVASQVASDIPVPGVLFVKLHVALELA